MKRKYTKGLLTKREEEALNLRIQKLNYTQIGAAMGINYKTACEYVTSALKKYREAVGETVKTVVELELASLDALEAKALANYEKAEGELQLKYLDRILKIKELRSKFEGTQAPEKLAVAISIGVPTGITLPALPRHYDIEAEATFEGEDGQ